MKSILYIFIAVVFFITIPYRFFNDKKQLVENFKNEFDLNFNQLQSDIEDFIKLNQEKASKKEIMKSYFKVRKSYKTIEPVILYFDKTAVEKDLNGAPLLKLEPKTPGITILKPKGLQVIDELMGEVEIDYSELESLSTNFLSNLTMVKNTLQIYLINHRIAFEIYQLNLIKLLTLELSGFDTPGTLNGIEDAKTTLKTINKIINPYLHDFLNLKNEINEIKLLMLEAEKFLVNSSNFNKFDRATFVNKYFEPLYKKINTIHKQSGVEYHDEVSKFTLSFNPRSNHVFSDDFLNPNYYAGVLINDNDDLIQLGKTLFFDPILSKNNQRACASCHSPNEGFANNIAKSLAFDIKGTLDRNSPTILNSIYANGYFHDLRADKISNLIEHVVFNEKEFASGYNLIEEKLKKSEDYQKLFAKSFTKYDGEYINKNAINTAITAYVKSLVGWNSQFDKFARGEPNNLSKDAKEGFNLFMGKAQCGICHFPPSFSGLVPPFFQDSESEVLGITTSFDTINPVLDSDLGRFASQKIKDKAAIFKNSFKTPTIRNAEITFPYMHNGAFKTLEEVLHFYNHGGGAGLGLDVENQTLPEDKLNLSKKEMHQIIAFIKSLTDTSSVDLTKPIKLPSFGNDWDKRKIGGEY
jgi:cytochrome c peroxidase